MMRVNVSTSPCVLMRYNLQLGEKGRCRSQRFLPFRAGYGTCLSVPSQSRSRDSWEAPKVENGGNRNGESGERRAENGTRRSRARPPITSSSSLESLSISIIITILLRVWKEKKMHPAASRKKERKERKKENNPHIVHAHEKKRART